MNVAWLELRYIPIQKYQVKSHSFPWFSAACATTVGHRNLFLLYQRKKSSMSRAKFRQARN